MEKKPHPALAAIRAAFPKTIPVLTGYLVLGIAYGVLMQTKGYGVPWVLLMCCLAYCGSMQFVPPITAISVPMAYRSPPSSSKKYEATLSVAAAPSRMLHLRRELGHNLQLRYAPEIVWSLDDSITYGAKMLKLINSLEIADESTDES